MPTLPSTWTRLPAHALEPSLARTKDGTLHLAWRDGARNLWHTVLAATAPPVKIAEGGASQPELLILSDGALQVFFIGAAGSLSAATSKDCGATWDVLSNPGHPRAASIAAVAEREGKTLVAFTEAGQVHLQSGLGATQKFETIRQGSCCADQLRLVLDGESSEAWLAWRQTAAKDAGLFVKAVKPASGATRPAPGKALQMALSPRIGAPGVYLAWCAGNGVKLWNVRGGEALTVAPGLGARNACLAPAPDGRLWILWINANHTVSAARSNKTLTRFSSPYALGKPAAAAGLQRLVAEASPGLLDVFADGFHTRLYPNLELRARADGVIVTDAGDPVEGAEVEIDGKKLKTDAKGLAAHPVAQGKLTPVKATMTAYAPASVVLKR